MSSVKKGSACRLSLVSHSKSTPCKWCKPEDPISSQDAKRLELQKLVCNFDAQQKKMEISPGTQIAENRWYLSKLGVCAGIVRYISFKIEIGASMNFGDDVQSKVQEASSGGASCRIIDPSHAKGMLKKNTAIDLGMWRQDGRIFVQGRCQCWMDWWTLELVSQRWSLACTSNLLVDAGAFQICWVFGVSVLTLSLQTIQGSVAKLCKLGQRCKR